MFEIAVPMMLANAMFVSVLYGIRLCGDCYILRSTVTTLPMIVA